MIKYYLAKSKLNSIKVVISKALIDSVIGHDEFPLINIVLKWKKKPKILIINKHNWCNIRNINIKKSVYRN